MTREDIIAVLNKMGYTKEQIAALAGEISKGESDNTYKVVRVIRLYWAKKPSKEDREAMSKCGYHWNGYEKFWYADATPEAIKFAGEHGFKEAK